MDAKKGGLTCACSKDVTTFGACNVVLGTMRNLAFGGAAHSDNWIIQFWWRDFAYFHATYEKRKMKFN